MNPEILERQERLQKLFDDVQALSEARSVSADIVVQLTWYLCIRTSGYLENAIQLILLDYVQSNTDDLPTQRFVEANLKHISSGYGDIMGIVRRFSEDWKQELRDKDVQRFKPSLTTMAENRNHIAHGRDSLITLQELQSYFVHATELVELLHVTCNAQAGNSSHQPPSP